MAESIARLPGPILVIGASGFVGANLLRALLDVRDDVFGTLLLGPAWRLESIHVRHLPVLDLLDSAAVRELLDRIQPRTIFHCAAYGAYSFQKDVARIHQVNGLALAQMLELVAERDVTALVHAGSSSEYGLNSTAPAEDAPRLPNSHYAVSKSAAADLIAYFGRVRRVPCVNLRLYSVYGPYEDSSRLVPSLITHGLSGSFPTLVSPDISRDFVYVDDVIAAFVNAALKMRPAIAGDSFNIASGKRITIRDAAETTRDLFGIAAAPVFGDRPPNPWDLTEWFGNPEKAERDLEWRAAYSFAEGLAATADWWKTELERRPLSSMSEQGRIRTEKNSLTAVVACYRDEPAIPIMHRRLTDTLQQLGLDYEIIFVNDCSPDNSEAVIRQLSAVDPRVAGITHSRNFGSQASFRSGMELSTREAVVLLDGDLQDPPELIEQFVAAWRNGHDVVYGRRVRREMRRGQELLYKAFYRVFNALSFIPMPTDAGDFSLIDRKVARWMLACEERDSFLRGLRAYVGFRQTGVDYVRPERAFGRSTNSLLANVGWAKKGIVSFSTMPLNLLLTSGLGLFALTLLAAVVITIVRVVRPDLALPGFTTVLLTIMFFGSVNLLGLATLGEYIGKILEETKARPPFIRAGLISEGRVRPAQPPYHEPTSGRRP
jgi:dolichol-phosphate mannosyltransferase